MAAPLMGAYIDTARVFVYASDYAAAVGFRARKAQYCACARSGVFGASR